jgi:hypothetical protein
MTHQEHKTAIPGRKRALYTVDLPRCLAVVPAVPAEGVWDLHTP